MGYSQFDDASRERAAWNAGKKVGAKRPFTQKQIWAIRFLLDRERRIRDRALFDLAIDSKLRGCDLVKIRIRDGGRAGDQNSRDRCSAKDRSACPIREHLSLETLPSGLARTTWGLGRGLCVPVIRADPHP